MTRPCGCPAEVHRTISDQSAHDAWHVLVVEQGGPDGAVDSDSVRAARGFTTSTPTSESILDVKARESGKRASGKLREASR